MKIAFFTDAYLDLTGGIVSSTRMAKKELEKKGHTVYLFSVGYPRSKKEIQKLKKQNIILVPSCKVFFRGLIPIARRPKIIEKWILKNCPEIRDFDVFHVHYEGGCSIAGIRLAHKLNIPVVQTMHGREDMGESNLIPFFLRTFVATMLNWFHSWYLPHDSKIKKDNYLAGTVARAKMWEMMVNHANSADVIISPSNHFKDKLKNYGVIKDIYIAPNGVDDDLVLDKCPIRDYKMGDELKIIWHSRVSAEKRMMPFLEALSMVKGNYHVDIYGGGGDYHRAVRYGKRHKLNVSFYNTTDFREIYKKMQKSHLDVLVSENFDTFGMTLIEAEAVGMPVFFCDPDMKEVIPAGSYVFSANSTPSGMAAAIDDLIEHPDRISKMSKIMANNNDEVRMSRRVLKLIEIYEIIRREK